MIAQGAVRHASCTYVRPRRRGSPPETKAVIMQRASGPSPLGALPKYPVRSTGPAHRITRSFVPGARRALWLRGRPPACPPCAGRPRPVAWSRLSFSRLWSRGLARWSARRSGGGPSRTARGQAVLPVSARRERRSPSGIPASPRAGAIVHGGGAGRPSTCSQARVLRATSPALRELRAGKDPCNRRESS